MIIVISIIGVIAFLLFLVCILTMLLPHCIQTYFEIRNYIYRQNNKTAYMGFKLSSAELLLILKSLNDKKNYSFGNENKELKELSDKITKALNDNNVYNIDF